MISHGKEIAVFTGNSNPTLAEDICADLYKQLGNSSVSHFADGECSISVYEPVRGKDVFIVQSTCKPVNDNLMELLIMTDAMRRASAGRITAVIPYFGYARQDRKAKAVIPYPRSSSRISSPPPELTACLLWICTPHRSRASSISLLTIFRALTCL